MTRSLRYTVVVTVLYLGFVDVSHASLRLFKEVFCMTVRCTFVYFFHLFEATVRRLVVHLERHSEHLFLHESPQFHRVRCTFGCSSVCLRRSCGLATWKLRNVTHLRYRVCTCGRVSAIRAVEYALELVVLNAGHQSVLCQTSRSFVVDSGEVTRSLGHVEALQALRARLAATTRFEVCGMRTSVVSVLLIVSSCQSVSSPLCRRSLPKKSSNFVGVVELVAFTSLKFQASLVVTFKRAYTPALYMRVFDDV